MTSPLIAFLGSIILAGLIASLFGVRTLFQACQSAKWPSVNGVIKSSKISASNYDESHNRSYKPLITYSYSVSGHQFTSDLISFGIGYYSGTREFVERYHALYSQGKQVTVFYDPNAPKMAVLEPGISRNSFIPLLFGLAFTLVGVIFALGIWYQESHKPNKTLQLTPSRTALLFHDRFSFPSISLQSLDARSG